MYLNKTVERGTAPGGYVVDGTYLQGEARKRRPRLTH